MILNQFLQSLIDLSQISYAEFKDLMIKMIDAGSR